MNSAVLDNDPHLQQLDQLLDRFMQRLEARGLLVIPAELAEERLQETEAARLRAQLLRKKALSFREISEAMIWTHSDGRKLNQKAVQHYAQKNARPEELIKVPYGQREIWKLATSAVQRLAIQRGNATL